jgi:D-apiose dehydrogenase
LTTIALIGCGHISLFHMRAWQQVPDAQIVAVCDVDETKARARANEFGVPLVFADPARMLDEVRPEAVDIATRPDTHLALTTLAAERGIHVLCQKPLQATLAAAREIAVAAASHNVRLMVNENWRWRTWFRTMKTRIDAGEIGRPVTARVETLGDSVDRRLAGQPYFAEMPQLMLYESAIHFVDALRFLVGDIEAVACRMSRVDERLAGEDTISVLMGHRGTAGRVTSVIEASWTARGYPDPATEAVRIEGTEATLGLENDGTLRLLSRSGATTIAPPDPNFYLSAFIGAQRHFVECLQTGAPFETSPEDNFKTLEAVFAGYQSAATGETVRVLA